MCVRVFVFVIACACMKRRHTRLCAVPLPMPVCDDMCADVYVYTGAKRQHMGYLPERLLAHIMEESLREQHITTFHQDLKFSAQ